MLKVYKIDPDLDLEAIIKEMDGVMIKGIDHQSREIEVEQQEIDERYRFCSWCEGVYDKETGDRVTGIPYSFGESHGICEACRLKTLGAV